MKTTFIYDILWNPYELWNNMFNVTGTDMFELTVLRLFEAERVM